MEKTRIKVGYDNNRETRLRKESARFCMLANSVIIPVMKKLGLEVDLWSVIRYAKNRSWIISDYVDLNKGKAEEEGVKGLLLELTIERATKEATSILKNEPDYMGAVTLSNPETVYIDKECNAQIDNDVIKNLCEIYITDPKEIEVRRYQEKAAQALNDFFKGRATRLDQCFTIREGVIYPVNINYSYFFK